MSSRTAILRTFTTLTRPYAVTTATATRRSASSSLATTNNVFSHMTTSTMCKCTTCSMNPSLRRHFFSSFTSSKDTTTANDTTSAQQQSSQQQQQQPPQTPESQQQAQQQQQSSQQQQQQQSNEFATKIAELEKMIADRDAKIKDLNDKWVRAVAETENVRKRGRTEVENTKKFAVQQFAKSMIEVADTLELAIANARPSVQQSTDPLVKTLFEGIEMTEKVLAKALESNSVKKFNAHGQKFDPNFHFALFQVDDESLEPNTVAQVLKHGYLLNERILRAANVGTTKAKPSGTHAPPSSSS
jgi:molecular chaperone GrpE